MCFDDGRESIITVHLVQETDSCSCWTEIYRLRDAIPIFVQRCCELRPRIDGGEGGEDWMGV